MRTFILPILQQIKENVATYKSDFLFDLAILIACAATFEVNNLAIKPLVTIPSLLAPYAPLAEAAASIIIHNHFNDCLGGLAFVAYTNLLLDIVNPQVRFHKLVPCLIYILMCGLVWEYIAPLFIITSRSDPLDLVAYLCGAGIYWLLQRCLLLQSKGNNRP